MLHKAVKKRIYSLYVSFIVILISACSEGGSSSGPESVSTGRTLDVLDSNIVFEGGSGETQALSLEFVSTVTGNITYQSFNMTAAEKSDYRPVAGAMNVLEGETYNVSVDIYGDDEIEGNEQFGISILDSASTEVLVLVAQINNDDLPFLSVNEPSISEGDFGTARLSFVLELSSPVVDPYEISVFSDGCEDWVDSSTDEVRMATPCVDFEEINTTLVFTSDVQTLSFDVVVISDDLVELDEIVELSVTSNGLEALAVGGKAQGTIRTDETPNDQGFSLSSNSLVLSEDKNNSAEDGGDVANDELWQLVSYTVDVVNPENIIQAQYVEFDLKGDEATQAGDPFVRASFSLGADSDYCVNNPNEVDLSETPCESTGRFLLEPDVTSFDLQFYVSADVVIEADEVIEIVLGNDQGVEFTTVYHTIENDDAPELIITVDGTEMPLEEFAADESNILTVSEGSGSLIISLKLATPVVDEWEVPFSFRRTSGGNVNADSEDYLKSSGNLVFSAGSQEPDEVLSATIFSDDRYEGDEFFELYLEGIGADSVKIKILDDDLPNISLVNSDGSDVTNTGATDDFGDSISYVELAEQLRVSSANSDSEGNITYQYKLLLDSGATSARSDLLFKYEVETLVASNSEYCRYLDSTSDQYSANASSSDYSLMVGDSSDPVLIGDEFVFSEGSTQLSVNLEVINDANLECDEYLAVTFYIYEPDALEDQSVDTRKTHSLVFQIPNKDQALLKVNGWDAVEGSNGVVSNQSFSLSLDQPINTVVPYGLSGVDEYSCNAEDITAPAANTGIVFENLSREASVDVLLIGDDVVEPDETCQLSVLETEKHNDYDLLEVQYCDALGENCSESTNGYAQGFIDNDDLLTITIDSESSVSEPAETIDDLVKPIGISWDKDIADNVGDIHLSLVRQECESDEACSELDSDYKLTSDFQIKNAGEVAVPATVTKQNWPLEIIADNLIESQEQLLVALAVTKGGGYIESIGKTELDISIVDNDLLTLSLEQRSSDCVGTVEQACSSEYEIKLDKSIADTVIDIQAKLSIQASNNVSLKQSANDVGYLDAVLNSIDSDGQVNEIYPEGGSFIVDINKDGVTQTPVFRLDMMDDALVEIEETLALKLEKQTVDDAYTVSADLNSISHTVTNNDTLIITMTQTAELNELDASPQSQPAPFTFTWDKPVASNVPDIELAIESTCDNNLWNCAEIDLTDTSDFSLQSLIVVHEENELGTVTLVPDEPLNLPVLYKLDTRVEADEYVNINVNKNGALINGNSTNIEGRGYIAGFNQQVGVAVTDTLALQSIILNDDFITVDITESNANCAGFSGESGCKEFTLGWDLATDADAGEVFIGLSTVGTSAGFLYNAEVDTTDSSIINDPKDYSLSLGLDGTALEITPGTNNLSLGSGGLQAGGQITFKINIENDTFVEPEETLQLLFSSDENDFIKSITDNGTGLANSLSPFTYTVEIEDTLLVTTQTSSSAPEAGDTGGVSNPFEYKTNLKVAPNTPDLSFTVAPVDCANTETCAALDSDYTRNETVALHNLNSTTDIEASFIDLGVAIQADGIVEADELIKLSLTANNAEYVTFSPSSLSYTILNADTLDLVVTNITDEAGETLCDGFGTGASAETGCRAYRISWVNGIDSALGEVSINLSASGSDTHMLYSDVKVNGVVQDPKDFSLLLNPQSLQSDSLPNANEISLGSSGLTENSNATFVINLLDDEFVEPAETLKLLMTAGSNVSALSGVGTNLANSATPFAHVVEIQDTLLVTPGLSAGNSGVEAEDTAVDGSSGIVAPFVYETDRNIAPNTPEISFTVANSCSAPDICATKDTDFSFTESINLHTLNNFNEQQAKTDLLVAITPDDIVEAPETVTLTLTPSNASYVSIASPSTLSYTIENTDALALIINDVTEDADDTSCAGGFDGESDSASCRLYQIEWHKSVASNAGEVVIDIDTAGTSADMLYTAEHDDNDLVIENPKDYSLSLGGEPLVNGSKLVLASSGSGLSADSSATFKIEILNDDFVEPVETLQLSLDTTSNLLIESLNIQENGIKTSDTLLTYGVPIEDKITVTVATTDADHSAAEPSYELEPGLAEPYTYLTNQKIAPNTPTLTMSVTPSTDSCPANSQCAVSDADFSVNTSITLHTNEEFTPLMVGTLNLGAEIKADNIVEEDELVRLTLGINESGYFTTVPTAPDYTIENVDFLDLTVVESINNCTAAGFQGESGSTSCREFNISWENVLAGYLDSATLEVHRSGDAVIEATVNNLDVTTDPSDYSLTPSIVTVVESGETTESITLVDNDNIANTNSMNFKVSINNDDFVEPEETLSLYLSKPLGSAIGTITDDATSPLFSSGTPLSYTIPIQDKLWVSVAVNKVSALEPTFNLVNEVLVLDEGVEKPFTYTTNLNIAHNTPDMSMTVTQGACNIVLCAHVSSDDYTVPGAITLHTSSASLEGFSPAITASTDLGVLIKADTVVEADEQVAIAIEADETTTTYLSEIPTAPYYTINNDDSLALEITELTDALADPLIFCTGFAAETDSCREFKISWSQEVSLDLSAPTISIDTSDSTAAKINTFQTDAKTVITDPQDFSLKAQGLGDLQDLSLADSFTLTDNGTGTNNKVMTVKIKVEHDTFVEPEETLSVLLASASNYIGDITKKDAGSTALFDSATKLTHTIPVDDHLTVNVQTSASSAAEPTYKLESGELVLGTGLAKPHTYTTDLKVAHNTPTITMTVGEDDCPLNTTCARTDTDDYTVPSAITLHTNSEVLTAFSPVVTNAIDLGVLIKEDDTIEVDEQVTLTITATESGYLSGLPEVPNYTIENDDSLALTITEITDSSVDSQADCTGFLDEDGCREFEISWNQEVSTDLDEPAILINTDDSTAAKINTYLTDAKTVITDPQDFSLKAQGVGDLQDLTSADSFTLTDNGTGTNNKVMTFRINVETDDFVEPIETLNVYLAKSSSYIGTITTEDDGSTHLFSSQDKITREIPIDEQLNVTVTPKASAVEPGDTNGEAAPFTYYTSHLVASNAPAITLTVGQATCPANTDCAIQYNVTDHPVVYDFTTPASFNLHNAAQFTAIKPSTGDPAIGDTDLGVIVQQDNIIEPDELIKLSLSVNTEAQSYVTFSSNEPEYTITNSDELDLVVTENTQGDCGGFTAEDESCREFNIAWTNTLEGDAAIIEVISGNGHDMSAINSYETDENSPVTDPQDYTVTASSYVNSDSTEITLTDNDGVDETTSMNIRVNIKPDDFVEPEETLNLNLAKPTGSAIGVITGAASSIFSSGGITHTVANDDFLTVTVASVDSAPEPGDPINDGDADVTNPLYYTIDKGIAKNVPEIELKIELTSCRANGNNKQIGYRCASSGTDGGDDTDFNFSSSVSIHADQATAYTSGSGNKDLGVTINGDDVVEVDEIVGLTVTENSGYISSITDAAVTYIIANNDKTQLTLTEVDTSKTEVSEGAENTTQNGAKQYSLSWTKEVNSDVDALNVAITLNGSATLNDDFTVSNLIGGLYAIKAADEKLDANGSTTLDININGDNTVEYNETLSPVLALDTANNSDDYTSIATSSINDFTIANDEYITISLPDTVAWPEGGDMAIQWSHGDTALGEALSVDLAITANEADLAKEFDDYDITPFTLAVDLNGLADTDETTLISLIDDTVIEKDESLTITFDALSAKNQQIIQFENASYSRTITDNDDLVVTALSTIEEGNDSANPQTYSLEFCKPNGYTVQDYSIAEDVAKGISEVIDSINYVLTVNNTFDNITNQHTAIDNSETLTESVPAIGDDSPHTNKIGYDNSYYNAVCGEDNGANDYLCAAEQTVSLSPSDFTSVLCKSVNVYTIYSDTTLEPNKHIQHDLKLDEGETRSEAFGVKQLTILNDDFTNITDTGMKKCTASNRDIVSCEDNSEHNKQDARATGVDYDNPGTYEKIYPTLAYSAVNIDGEPALTSMTSDNSNGYTTSFNYADKECFQDNNTGMLWSGVLLAVSSGDAAMPFSTAPEITLTNDKYCGQAEADWTLPSVQDLYAVMVMHHLYAQDQLTPRSTLRGASQYQDEVALVVDYDDQTPNEISTFTSFYKSAYWSSDVCGSDGVTGYWTVDFFTGLTRCEDPSATNFKILVHKPI